MTINATDKPGAFDVNDKWLYKAGGIFAYAISFLFIVDIGLGIALGTFPTSSGITWLSFVNAKREDWSALIYVTVISDLLLMVVYSSLYTALRPVSRGLMLIATVWAIFGTVLDEVIANANFGSLLTLSGQYAAAGTAAQRAADVAAADYAAAILSSRLDSIFADVIPAVAFILIGIVMLRSPFGRRLAYLGIATGVFTLLQITGWNLAGLLSVVLEAIWLALVGRCLYFRYAAPAPVPAELPEGSFSA